MNFYEVLFHPEVVMAAILYLLLGIAFELIYSHFLTLISHESASHWIARNIMGPFVHVVLLIGFVFLSYPIIFGMQEAPALKDLLNQGESRTMQVINIVFVISVILPLIPLFKRLTALILPLQAMSATAVVYTWVSEALEKPYSIFPGFSILLLIIALSLISNSIARWCDEQFSQLLNEKFNTTGWELILQRSTLMLFQIPILLIYTLNLD